MLPKNSDKFQCRCGPCTQSSKYRKISFVPKINNEVISLLSFINDVTGWDYFVFFSMMKVVIDSWKTNSLHL